MPRVSVVMPTYNRAHFIAETVQSVLGQTFADFELIVVDDGSTDNTKEVIGSLKDPRIRYIYQENRGVSAARNTGIRTASGEYIAFQDSDDIWLPQNLELKVRRLDARPDIALVCSDAYIFNSHTGVTLGRRWHDKPFHYCIDPEKAARQPLKELLSRGCFITPQATMVRRLVFDDVGYFDESLRTQEDWDMFVRIVRHFPIETIDVPLVSIRQHDVSLSASWDRMYFGATVVLNKALKSYSLSNTELNLVKSRLARLHLSYGKSLVANGRIDLGREKLLAAIKIKPWLIRPYFYLAASLLGNAGIFRLKSWKKRLKQVHV
ncbi:MAG: hypothetical protein A2144_11185 [Chloroflexi bacterium RBG_16_50_9]|nr:MAG: hypothetical protein A2144_11185 [Chloroflexi bacterium RBG_16_50_9]